MSSVDDAMVAILTEALEAIVLWSDSVETGWQVRRLAEDALDDCAEIANAESAPSGFGRS